MLPKTVFPVLVEHLGAGLHKQVRSFLGPLHLLPFHQAPGQYLVHRRFHKARRYPFALALALGVIDNKAAVLLHMGIKINK